MYEYDAPKVNYLDFDLRKQYLSSPQSCPFHHITPGPSSSLGDRTLHCSGLPHAYTECIEAIQMPWRGSGKVSWVHSDATNKCCKYPVPGRKVKVKKDQEMRKKGVQEQRNVETPRFHHWIHHGIHHGIHHWIHHWKNTRINWKHLRFLP